MELFDVQNMMRAGEKPKLLIFCGADYFLANTYVNNLADFYGIEKTGVSSLDSVLEMVDGDEMFSVDRAFVYKYPNAKELANSEKFFESCEEEMGNNILMIVVPELDKRTKFYKTVEKYIVNCAPQDLKTFRAMAENYTKLSPDSVKILAEICENNFGKFLSEQDKVKNISSCYGITEDEALKMLLDNGVIYSGNKDVLFSFINRVMEAKSNLYEHYEILKRQGESGIKILSILYTSFRNQFIVETVINPTAESTGISGFVLSSCLRRRGKYTVGQLRYALRLIMQIEQGIKSGLFEEASAVDYFLSEFLL